MWWWTDLTWMRRRSRVDWHWRRPTALTSRRHCCHRAAEAGRDQEIALPGRSAPEMPTQPTMIHYQTTASRVCLSSNRWIAWHGCPPAEPRVRSSVRLETGSVSPTYSPPPLFVHAIRRNSFLVAPYSRISLLYFPISIKKPVVF